jgi:hypothetical protein
MNEQVMDRFTAFAHWGEEAFLNKYQYTLHKAEVAEDLRTNKKQGYTENKHNIEQLKNTINRKQEQMNSMKIQTYEEMQEAMHDIVPLFVNMHAELFAKEIQNSINSVHKNTVALHDSVTRQLRVLEATDKETFEELVPHIIYLYDKEKQLQSHIQNHAERMHSNATKLIKHMNQNYFGRLSRVANTEEFYKDHSHIFTAAYLLCVASRAVAKVQGADTRNLASLENEFIENIAPYGR